MNKNSIEFTVKIFPNYTCTRVIYFPSISQHTHIWEVCWWSGRLMCKICNIIRRSPYSINTLRPRQNWRHFADDTFKCIFMNENARISIYISLKFVPRGLINNIPALVQIMARRRPGDKPLSEAIMVNLLTHIFVTRPQWVKSSCIIPCKYTLPWLN